MRRGDKLKNYEILAELRPGGMGTLYLATRLGAAGFRQYVAIKLIHPHLSIEPRFVSSFVNEALLGARIAHPNVVRVEELGEEEGRYFLVMEYVHGCSVSALLRKLRDSGRMLKPATAVAIAARAADGLHAAHETTDDSGASLGLVHRDVSPQNILLSVSGAVKLIDFGIAKAMAQGVETATGLLKGKIRYMSPEQAFGRPLDRRSDVYALGIVLWEMLTQRRLFKGGDDLAVLDVVRAPQIPPPSQYVRDVPEALEAVLMQALRIDPAERPATAQEFRVRLLTAVPGAHDVDGARLAKLIGDVMHAELVAGEEKLPPEARIAVPRTLTAPEDNAMTATLEGRFAEPPGRVWSKVAGGLVLAVLGIAAAWFISGGFAPPPAEPAPPPPPPVEVAPTTADLAPPPVERAPPPVVEVAPTAPAAARTKAVHTKRRRRKGKPGPRDVDGVPLLEKPDF